MQRKKYSNETIRGGAGEELVRDHRNASEDTVSGQSPLSLGINGG